MAVSISCNASCSLSAVVLVSLSSSVVMSSLRRLRVSGLLGGVEPGWCGCAECSSVGVDDGVGVAFVGVDGV